jgi:hypothetical protein
VKAETFSGRTRWPVLPRRPAFDPLSRCARPHRCESGPNDFDLCKLEAPWLTARRSMPQLMSPEKGRIGKNVTAKNLLANSNVIHNRPDPIAQFHLP